MILVFGGTSESLKVCKKLNELKTVKYILSVATDFGKQLANEVTKSVVVGKMNKDKIADFIEKNDVSQIIDATHPYALEISQNAMEVSRQKKIKYVRFERKSMLNNIDYRNITIVDSLEEACNLINRNDKYVNVFVGTGSKYLDLFSSTLEDKNLIVRVLPTSEVIVKCEKLGFNANNLIAMKGPFSRKLNVCFYEHYDIDVVVTKESGIAGGFIDKIEACKDLDIPVIIMRRKVIEYDNLINEIDEIEEVLK